MWVALTGFVVTASCTGTTDDEVTSIPSGPVVDSEAPDPSVTSRSVPPSPTTPPPPAPSTSAAAAATAERRITIDAGRFVDNTTGDAFVPRGVNYVKFTDVDRTLSPDRYDPTETAADFAWLADRGYNTVRVFLDTCSAGPGCITQIGSPGVSGEFLDVVVDLLGAAKREGLVVIFTSNDVPDGGGYRDISAAGDAPGVVSGYRNVDFLTDPGHRSMVAYWTDLLDGLVARGAAFDAVLGWSILNEQWLFELTPPLSLTSGLVETAAGTFDVGDPLDRRAMVVESIRLLIDDVGAVIRERDPGALVTMGFFSPDFPNATSIGGDWYVDTAPLVEDSSLDFFDFHAYAAEDISVTQLAQNFGIDARKPVIMGEVGAFVDRFDSAEDSALALQRHIAESCDAGWDGWLLWAFDPIPLADRTWAFTDSDGHLADALAPVNQPDPCVVTLSDPNLLVGATLSASSFLPGEEPDLVRDGSSDSQWGSGAEPVQWIDAQFPSPVSIGSIELRVAQFPDGPTVHQVTATLGDGSSSVIQEFVGETSSGQVLSVSFEPSIDDVVSLRFTTTASPSWVSWSEIEVRAA